MNCPHCSHQIENELTRKVTELEAKCVQKDEALKNLVGHFTQGDIRHFRSKHKGSSAGEMCCGDVVKAVESLSPTCGDSLLRDKAILKSLVEEYKDLKGNYPTLRKFFEEQFPTTQGHIPLIAFCSVLDAAISNTKQEGSK